MGVLFCAALVEFHKLGCGNKMKKCFETARGQRTWRHWRYGGAILPPLSFSLHAHLHTTSDGGDEIPSVS